MRISALLLVFVILCSLYYLDRVGLPNFVKGQSWKNCVCADSILTSLA